MSALNFVRSATRGVIVPQHCGKPIRFGIMTSRCSGCNETFDTLDVMVESQKLDGRDYNPLDLAVHLLNFGLSCNQPMEVPPFSLAQKENPKAELSAQSEALAAIAKARGK